MTNPILVAEWSRHFCRDCIEATFLSCWQRHFDTFLFRCTPQKHSMTNPILVAEWYDDWWLSDPYIFVGIVSKLPFEATDNVISIHFYSVALHKNTQWPTQFWWLSDPDIFVGIVSKLPFEVVDNVISIYFYSVALHKKTQWPTPFWWLSDTTTGGWVIPTFSLGLYRSYHSKPQTTSFRNVPKVSNFSTNFFC
jgi:hypothetical protein